MSRLLQKPMMEFPEMACKLLKEQCPAAVQSKVGLTLAYYWPVPFTASVSHHGYFLAGVIHRPDRRTRLENFYYAATTIMCVLMVAELNGYPGFSFPC